MAIYQLSSIKLQAVCQLWDPHYDVRELFWLTMSRIVVGLFDTPRNGIAWHILQKAPNKKASSFRVQKLNSIRKVSKKNIIGSEAW